MVLHVVKAALSAVYWYGCLYVATGMFFGDRIVDGRIAPPQWVIPPWLFALMAILVYAGLSITWDRLLLRRDGNRPH
ncbi:hypothetical protein [Sphingomonas sp.]|uniref:hypothetical protein n=1 Tax=Sphingomonas sp. TaxID=28214 RepID=UPI003D6D5049